MWHKRYRCSTSAVQVEGASQLAALGHGFAMQAFLAIQASDLTRARSLVRRAVEIAAAAADPALTVRVGIIERDLLGDVR